MESRWRAHAQQVVRAIIEACPEADEKELRRLISAAYPFGERAMHPYKIWLSEVKTQLDQHFGRARPEPKTATETREQQEQAGQLVLVLPAVPARAGGEGR